MMLGSQYACRSRPTRWFRSDLSLMRERSYLMRHYPCAILYMVGSMLIMSFMVVEAGISCLETHEISTIYMYICLGRRDRKLAREREEKRSPTDIAVVRSF